GCVGNGRQQGAAKLTRLPVHRGHRSSATYVSSEGDETRGRAARHLLRFERDRGARPCRALHHLRAVCEAAVIHHRNTESAEYCTIRILRALRDSHSGPYCAAGGAATGEPCAAPASPLTKSFNSLLGLKNGIFLAGTSTRSPVLGFRPTRELRWRVRKLPKPRISILSPALSEWTMLSKMVSTITSLSRRVTSVIRATSSIRSAFVISCTFHPRCGNPSSANRDYGM